MRKLFGNGRPIAAAILAVGIAAIAVPAFGDSAKKGGSGAAAARPAPGFGTMTLPPPPPMTGAMRKRAEKAASCMQGKHVTSRKALEKAAKDCGAPPPPPPGKLLPGMPRGKVLVSPGKLPPRGKLPPPPLGAAPCVHASKRR
jgi:hypothetical protein